MKTGTTIAVLALAAAALAGCGRRDDTQPVRAAPAVAVASSGGAEAAAKAARDAAEATRRAAEDARAASKNAADQATNKVADALITTSVHAELAKDPKLATLRIDVDTDNGRVALRGVAPDEAVRARATQVAGTVEGVVSVENQLTIDPAQGHG